MKGKILHKLKYPRSYLGNNDKGVGSGKNKGENPS